MRLHDIGAFAVVGTSVEELSKSLTALSKARYSGNGNQLYQS